MIKKALSALCCLLQLLAFAGPPIQIMPLCDSITVGQYGSGFNPGGWRYPLEVKLLNSRYNFTFIGSSNTNPAVGQINIWHEGHSGMSIGPRPGYYCLRPFGINDFLPLGGALQPNIIIFFMGINDVRLGVSAVDGANNITNALVDLSNRSPQARIICCTLIGCADDGGKYLDVNVILRSGAVKVLQLSGRNIELCDLALLGVYPLYMQDSVHPNVAGNAMIADKLFDQIMRQSSGTRSRSAL